MSDVDKELTWKSPVRLVAWEVIGRGANHTYDFDPSSNLTLEARVLPGYTSPALWPQVIFEPNGLVFRADLQEMEAVGAEQFLRTFHTHLLKARRTLQDGSRRPRWLWKRIRHPPRQCRYPPRVFTRHTYAEFNDKMHFECAYLGRVDKGKLLHVLDSWRPFQGGIGVREIWDLGEPESHLQFRPRFILRALVKIGVNLLAYICDRTKVGPPTFPEAIAFARYDDGKGPNLNTSGFIVNEDIQELECPPAAHKFSLTYDQRMWLLVCSFFGGRIGATVQFPGRNDEQWRRVEVVAPLRSADWSVSKSRLLLRVRLRIVWKDPRRMVPSVRFKNLETQVHFEPVRPAKKQNRGAP